MRLLLGVQTARFLANKPAGYVAVSDEEMAPLAYHAASRPWVGSLARGWPDVFRASIESNAQASEEAARVPTWAHAYARSATALLTAVEYEIADRLNDKTRQPRLNAAGPVTSRRRAFCAARERGFLPHLHKIPPTAFDPEPTPQEKEEP